MKDRSVWIVVVVFSAIFLFGAFKLFEEARLIDDFLNGKVRAIGDDHEYQRHAINLRYGVGYTQNMVLPLETYRFEHLSPWGQTLKQWYQDEGSIIIPPFWNFYRAPGYPMMLSVAYTLFGDSSFTARSMTVVLIWAIAMITLITGGIWGGWRGALAAGVVGIVFVFTNHIRSQSLDRLMSEIPTTFWMALFGLCFILFQKTERTRYLLTLSVITVCLIYTRANMLMILPLFVIYFVMIKVEWKKIAIFSTIVIVPVAIWTAYASINVGTFVSFTTQGANAFPQYNNIDVLEGVGPDRLYQGEWNPGYHLDEAGNLIEDYRFVPEIDESGWAIGLAFWRDNPLRLPELFYVKLRAGFWTKETMAALYTAGLCFIFIGIGLRKVSPDQRIHILPGIGSRRILKTQVALSLSAILLLIVVGKTLYWLVLILFAVIIILALVRPYGDVFRLPVPSTNWFLVFIVSHFITTVLYMGVRFHEPLDPLLCMFGVYGFIILMELLLLPRRQSKLYRQPVYSNTI